MSGITQENKNLQRAADEDCTALIEKIRPAAVAVTVYNDKGMR